jgi:hypothetical protein
MSFNTSIKPLRTIMETLASLHHAISQEISPSQVLTFFHQFLGIKEFPRHFSTEAISPMMPH